MALDQPRALLRLRALRDGRVMDDLVADFVGEATDGLAELQAGLARLAVYPAAILATPAARSRVAA